MWGLGVALVMLMLHMVVLLIRFEFFCFRWAAAFCEMIGLAGLLGYLDVTYDSGFIYYGWIGTATGWANSFLGTNKPFNGENHSAPAFLVFFLIAASPVIVMTIIMAVTQVYAARRWPIAGPLIMVPKFVLVTWATSYMTPAFVIGIAGLFRNDTAGWQLNGAGAPPWFSVVYWLLAVLCGVIACAQFAAVVQGRTMFSMIHDDGQAGHGPGGRVVNVPPGQAGPYGAPQSVPPGPPVPPAPPHVG